MSLLLRMGNGSRFALIVVVGLSLAASSAHASLLGAISSVNALNKVTAIGPNGELVGMAATQGSSANHAFLSSNGVLTDLGTLGGTTSSAQAINAAGQVVGQSGVAGDGSQHAFLYSGGSLTDLGTLGGSYSSATGINSSGQVAGTSALASGFNHAFVYSNGKMTDLGTLGGIMSTGSGINDAGQVVGQSAMIDGSTHAFIANHSVLTDLGTLGGSSSFGYAINNVGQVVGQAYTTNDAAAHAFLWSNGKMIDLGSLPGFTASTATSINDSGVVVGYGYGGFDSNTQLPLQHAFVYQNGAMTDLNTLIPAGSGWTISQVMSINDNGVITGIGSLNGTREIFTAQLTDSPMVVPEPSLVTFAVMVFASFGARRAFKAYSSTLLD